MIKFTTIKREQEISALVCQEEGEKSLINIDSLKDMGMGIIHKEFPLPMDPSMREDPERIRLVNTEINRIQQILWTFLRDMDQSEPQ